MITKAKISHSLLWTFTIRLGIKTLLSSKTGLDWIFDKFFGLNWISFFPVYTGLSPHASVLTTFTISKW